MDNCMTCAVNGNCTCHKCINFYEKNITYEGHSSCIDAIMNYGCSKFDKGRSKNEETNYGCSQYSYIDWIVKIKYYKKINAGRKRLKNYEE